MKKQKIEKSNRIGTYLAVTAGVGCATSVANAAIVVVDLSGLSTTAGALLTFPNGDAQVDVRVGSFGGFGNIYHVGFSAFYSDINGFGGNGDAASGYQSTATVSFPSDGDTGAFWYLNGLGAVGNFEVGTNWVAFRDSDSRYGWLSFDLASIGDTSTGALDSFGSFVYDDTSTNSSNAISLGAAVATVPEPSGLALLALGSIGLAARRSRKN